MTATAHKRTFLASVAERLQVVPLESSDPSVERLVQAYRDQFGLGPRQPMTERAGQWWGGQLDGKTVAVFGDLRTRNGRHVEISAGLHDGSPEGKAAYAAMAYGYYAMLERGEIDEILHACLYRNEEEWQAIVRETGDMPEMLVFIHRRKEKSP